MTSSGFTLRSWSVSNLHAAYLHSRQPADARIALWSDSGPEGAVDFLPLELRAKTQPVIVQLLLPSEEASFALSTSRFGEADDEDRTQDRIAPALWSIPALGLRLDDALPWLASLEPAHQPPALRALSATCHSCCA